VQSWGVTSATATNAQAVARWFHGRDGSRGSAHDSWVVVIMYHMVIARIAGIGLVLAGIAILASLFVASDRIRE
jgi:hypothetical protein